MNPQEHDRGDPPERAPELPIIDFLARDPDSRAFLVTIIPDERVARAEKELVTIGPASPDYAHIANCLGEMRRLLGLSAQLRVVSHTGDDNYTFHTDAQECPELSGAALDDGAVMRIHELLRHIAEFAQFDLIARRRQKAG